ncbi:MAG: hypothetical protein ACR2PS_00650 [Pseudomonadales bacterium]
MSELRNYLRYVRRITAALLLVGLSITLGCDDGDDNDEVVLELDPESGGAFDVDAYSATAAADSLTGLWLLVGNYDYLVDDSAVRGAGRELVRASVRIQDGDQLTFTSCYAGTPPQTPQRQADGSFTIELSGGVASLAPNADNNRLTGSFVSNAGSIDFQGSVTLIRLSADNSLGLGTMRVTSAALDEEAALNVDCFFEAEQELADRTGTNDPNEIVIRLSNNNQQLLDLYVEGSATDQQLRIKALQGVGRDVNLEFITPSQAIGVNKAGVADITISGSDPAGLQASLGAAEGDQQASVAVDIALP